MGEKRSDFLGPTAYPGETPQAESDASQLKSDYSVGIVDKPPERFNWAMSGTHVSVSNDDHGVQFEGMAWTDYNRPYAYGVVDLHFTWNAMWTIVYTNMSIPLVEKRLKRYTKDQGWEWAGIQDHRGMSMDTRKASVFIPPCKLVHGSTATCEKCDGWHLASVPGIGEINPGLKDWRNNEWSGMETFDNPGDKQSETPFYGFQDPEPSDIPSDSPRTCSECGELCLNYDEWRKHTLRNHINPERKPPGEPQPVVDLDDVLPAGFNEAVMDKTVQRQSRLLMQLTAAGPQIPQLPGPLPFIYDIEQDRIYVGHPGERHSDIEGRFTPGGLIEGLYDPKGNVQIRTDTDMPYTVRHMIQLWYALHPELLVKAVYLAVGTKKYKLASAGIGHTVRNLVATDPAAWAAYQALEPHGNVYAVGGVVRDVVLGKTPKDVDLMVQGVDAEDVGRILSGLPGRVDFTGKQFGVFRYRDPGGNEVEVALPRTERSTGPGHRDFEVITNPYISVGEDLARRDFTGNAMAVNLATGDLVDPYHGSEDLKSGLLRTVSDRSFVDDPLRILRAFGAISRHGLDPTPETYHGLAAHAERLNELPAERLQMELDKLMSGSDPAKAVDLMEATGVLQHILPDVAATVGFDQKSKYHAYPLNEHIKDVLRRAASLTSDVDVRWAALLHDIGKPKSQWFDEEGYGHYYKTKDGQGADHEDVGAEMARRLLTDLKFPNDRIDRIVHLIQHHMFPAFNSQGGARKFINRVGDQHADDVLTLRDADSGGKGLPHDGQVPLMRQYVQSVRDAGEPTSAKMLALNGHDLQAYGMKPGPQMGAVLKRLVDLVLEDPSLNDKSTLLGIAASENPELFNPSGGQGELAKSANILDPVKDELDPAVFNRSDDIDPQVKPKIVEWVKNKVYKTMTKAGWPNPEHYLNLILTGSLTTYQWSEESDFDVSLWIDVKELPEFVRADLIALMIEQCDGTIVPGTTHPIQCFVVDVKRTTKGDLYKPGLRSAYDLDKGEWLVLPERDRGVDVYTKYPEWINYAKMVEDKVRMMLIYDKAALKVYWDFLHHRRFLDQKAGKGDFTESNVVYKWLNNRGLFPYISEATGEHLA